jgi:hypothetical protein
MVARMSNYPLNCGWDQPSSLDASDGSDAPPATKQRYPLEWGWDAPSEPEIPRAQQATAAMPTLLGGADVDSTSNAKHIGGPEKSGLPEGKSDDTRQAYLNDGSGNGNLEKCPLMPNIQQFGFCLYVCPSGGVRRLDKSPLGAGCQPFVFPSGGIGL